MFTTFLMQTGPQNDTKIDVIFVKSRFRLVKGPPGTHCDTQGRMLHVGRVDDQKKGRFWEVLPGHRDPIRLPKIKETHADILQKDNKRQTT